MPSPRPIPGCDGTTTIRRKRCDIEANACPPSLLTHRIRRVLELRMSPGHPEAVVCMFNLGVPNASSRDRRRPVGNSRRASPLAVHPPWAGKSGPTRAAFCCPSRLSPFGSKLTVDGLRRGSQTHCEGFGLEIPLLNVERLCPETTPESARAPVLPKQNRYLVIPA